MVRSKTALAKNFNIQPSEIERMPYWEYELMIKMANEMIDEENKKNDELTQKYDTSSMERDVRRASRGDFSGFSKNMPGAPSIPAMPSMPAMPSIPKFN